jgi:alkylhydroperoxidase family enzyme
LSPKIPKLTFDELPPSIAALLRPKYERLGYLGEFFARTAHQEAALRAFIEFTDAAKGALPDNIVELIALTVATMKGVDYEKNQHERLSLKLGLDRGWVADVERLAPEDAVRLDAIERTVQRYVITAVERDRRGAAPWLDRVVDALGYENAVAVMMVMGRYTTHAIIVNSLDIEVPVPSIFPDAFASLRHPDGSVTNEGR